jgi:2-(1,2-epoxy-1,2-dihydrophenyl)acetyl-CoA isomerase
MPRRRPLPRTLPAMDLEHAYETVNLYRRGGELRIELNRPDAMNAWNRQLGEDLRAAIERAAGDDVRAVVITGAGRAFSSGADLKAGFDLTPEGHPDLLTPLGERYHPIIRGIRELQKPVVAAVNGPAVGIGCSLALACDLVIAAERAYFLLAFVNIGLVPDGGLSSLLPERVGFTRASEMAMLGERVPAAKAVEWGLANRAVPDADFAGEVDALATRLATGPTASFAGSKRQLNAWLFTRMEDQLELEAAIQQQSAASGDFREGVAAFLAKRSPEFRGS